MKKFESLHNDTLQLDSCCVAERLTRRSYSCKVSTDASKMRTLRMWSCRGTAWVGRLGAGYSYVPLRAATDATKTLKADLPQLNVIVPTTTTTTRNPSDKLTSTWASLRQMCRIDECPTMKPFRLLLGRQNPTQLTSALLFGMDVQHAGQNWVYGGHSNV
jgi:hypothetical protein